MTVLGHFDMRTMLEVVRNRPLIPSLLRTLFFSRPDPLSTAVAEMEILTRGKQVLPFVADHAGAVIIDKLGREARTVKTPRIRVKKPFGAGELLDFSVPGEIHYAQDDDVERRVEAVLVEEVDDTLDRISATEEWMCAQAVKGSLSYSGEDIEFTIDYRMPAEHKITLGSGERWGDTGVVISKFFNECADLIIEECGMAPDVCLMGKNAWSVFRNDEAVQKDFDSRNLNPGNLDPRVGRLHKGTYEGCDIYRYGGTVTDHDGAPHQLLDDDSVLFGCTYADSRLLYGLPEELAGQRTPMQFFAKTYLKDDPSALWHLVESRPLPLPRQPGAFVHATVVAS